jgi:hypothetical protein
MKLPDRAIQGGLVLNASQFQTSHVYVEISFSYPFLHFKP